MDSLNSLSMTTNTKEIFTNDPSEVTNTTRQEEQTVAAEHTTAPQDARMNILGDHHIQDISNVLTAWTYISNFVWSNQEPPPLILTPSAELGNYLIYNKPYPSTYFKDDLVYSKINYFNFYRGTLVFQLKVNANPLQQGMLYMFWMPLEGGNQSRPGPPVCSLTQLTTYPGVFLNIEDTDNVELEVPFMWNREYYDLTVEDALGSLGVCVIGPLRSDEDTPQVECILNVRVMDHELRMPTSQEAYRDTVVIYEDPPWDTPLEAVTQIGSEPSNPGLVTGVANGVAALTSALGNINIPVVSSVASKVSWASRLIGRASSALGFSKPDMTTTTTPIVDYSGYGAQHIESVIPGQNLGAIQDNSITHPTQGADEMAFDHLCAIPLVFESKEISVPTFNIKGDIWWQGRVQPIPDEITYPTTATEDTVFGGPMQCLASCFALWRGTLIYKFKLVKTKFVKGRLQVSFTPGLGNITSTPNINRVYTKIWDVGVDSEFRFEVPWAVASAFLPTSPDGFLGTLSVSVFNKFSYPTTISDRIQLVISLEGKDMEFLAPTMEIRAAAAADYMPDTRTQAHQTLTADTQIGYEDQFTVPPLCTRVGGEKVSSVRQLCKKIGRSIVGTQAWDKNPVRVPLSMFVYGAGSIRTLISVAETAAVYPAYPSSYGLGINFSTNFPWVTPTKGGPCFFTLPYYNKYPCVETLDDWPNITSSVAPGAIGQAIGDDYSAWGRRPPMTFVHKISY